MTPAAHFTKFGRYEIIRKLGRSLTDVYLALDPQTKQRVVLKIVEQCKDALTEIVVQAERRGASIQQQLHDKDSRILEVLEYGEANGCFFVAMQYAEGRSLAEMLIKNNRLEPMRAARYMAEVCSQLTTLHTFQTEFDGHKLAVVHGDIKPSNIQIGPNDKVWLLDFGIAKFISETRNLTSHNLGSPAYCSPERLSKAQVDPQADLWATAVTLYEMIAGIPPYQARTTRKLESLIQSRRPPRALPASCPNALRAVIWKALAADIAHRYPSAAAMQSDLEAFLRGHHTVAEMETNPSWDSNATLEKERPAVQVTISHWRDRYAGFIADSSTVLWALSGGMLTGVLLFVPAIYLYRFWNDSTPLRTSKSYAHRSVKDVNTDWQLYKKLQQESKVLWNMLPISKIDLPFHESLSHGGTEVIDSYRNSGDPEIANFDWEKARTCFQRALDMDAADIDAKAGIALTEGYAALLPDSMDAKRAEARFQAARRLMPKSPDPHLALARVYAYGLHNAGQTVAELHAAERLGYKLGPRESQQQAEAYYYRAMQEWKSVQASKAKDERRRLWTLAQRDFQRAKDLLEPIEGFSTVGAKLARVEKDEAAAKKWIADSERPRIAVAKKRYDPRTHRWR